MAIDNSDFSDRYAEMGGKELEDAGVCLVPFSGLADFYFKMVRAGLDKLFFSGGSGDFYSNIHPVRDRKRLAYFLDSAFPYLILNIFLSTLLSLPINMLRSISNRMGPYFLCM